MGKWVEVKCNCPDRIEIGQPYQPNYRYACGHPDGTLFQKSPSDLFSIGRALEMMAKNDPVFAQRHEFSVYRRIDDNDQFVDEYLALSFEERDLWQLETEELLKFVAGDSWFPYPATEIWNDYWQRDAENAKRWGVKTHRSQKFLPTLSNSVKQVESRSVQSSSIYDHSRGV